MSRPNPDPVGFGVYVHWPFCASKCPYCDFNSHVRHGGVDQDAFAAGYVREIEHLAARTGSRTITSIFFGGGTPSLMSTKTLGTIFDALDRHWDIAPDAEITLEANPSSVEAERFAAYRTAGINRVSLGIQSLQDDELQKLGRLHSVSEAMAALEIAHRVFSRVSFDLIYARPRQTPQQWHDELTRALAEQDGHMSLYQLTIEPETAFFDLHEAGSLKIPDEDTGAELYELTQELTAAAGLPAYEVSNHAAPGKECRHNMLYWRYGEYAGVGPGAHGRLVDANGVRRATVTERHPETWLSMVRSQGNGLTEQAPVSGEDAAAEYVLMSLRTQEGTSLARLATLAGRQPDQETLSDLCAGGFLSIEPDGEDQRLVATARGRQLLNAVIEQVVLKALR
jgi:oxygen-independent coproporphyrinogen-3 oxidase